MARRRSAKERFLAKVSKNGCWLWEGAKSEAGYGRFKFDGVNCYAHRVSYLLFVGDIGPELEVMHLCDHTACVNPKHLRLGTSQENSNYKYSEKFYGPGKPLRVCRRLPGLEDT